MLIDKFLIDNLLAEASKSTRLRMNCDLRTTPEDNSQRILNALLPGTPMPVHRHTKTTETLVLLRGKMEEIFYEEQVDTIEDGDSRCMDLCRKRTVQETERILLSADGPVQGLCIPVGQWHSINVLEPTVILECKDGAYEPLGPEDTINL